MHTLPVTVTRMIIATAMGIVMVHQTMDTRTAAGGVRLGQVCSNCRAQKASLPLNQPTAELVHDGGNANMKGVYLHIVADALGSVGVIISSLMIQYVSSLHVDLS